MSVVRFLVRAFAFVQWLGSILIAVACAVLQAQALEEPGDAPAAEGFAELFGGIGPLVVSVNMTLPGLLVSIVLMLSAIYCDRAGGRNAPPPVAAKSGRLSGGW